jgi:hypothetical protein
MVRQARELQRALRPSQLYRRVAATPEPGPRRRVADLVLIAGFLATIWLPLAGMLLGLDAAFVLPENRNLAPRPSLAVKPEALRTFPGQFEAYFNDQFGFRKRLIHWLSIVKVEGLGVSTSLRVVLGKDGWLFFTDEPTLQYYRNLHRFTPEEIEAWRRALESRRDWLAARGIKYLFVVMPNRETIYPERMPAAYNQMQCKSRLDRLVNCMRTNSDLPVLDVRDDLRRAREAERLYDVTDSHWNAWGAYVAYRRIVETLSTWFHDMKPLPRSGNRKVAQVIRGGDLALMLGLQDRMSEERLALEPQVPWRAHPIASGLSTLPPGVKAQIPPMEQDNPRLPRAVVFHDSFIGQLVPSLSEHFPRVVYVADHGLDRKLVEWERPDVVIQEMVERVLLGPPAEDH